MTIDKAIEFLEFLLKEHPRIESADFGSAIKLGIEALKELKLHRQFMHNSEFELMPGEDPE